MAHHAARRPSEIQHEAGTWAGRRDAGRYRARMERHTTRLGDGRQFVPVRRTKTRAVNVYTLDNGSGDYEHVYRLTISEDVEPADLDERSDSRSACVPRPRMLSRRKSDMPLTPIPLRDDVLAYVYDLFAQANVRVTAKLDRMPTIHEESLDLALIEALSDAVGPHVLPSGAVVDLEAHFVGGGWHWERWEIADLGIIVNF